MEGIIYQGPALDDLEILEKLPEDLREMLLHVNGLIAFDGGLHLRGACLEPSWHSLRGAWFGANAVHKHYRSVGPDWVPFAQDCMGDQFLLCDGKVLKLLAETGDIDELGYGLAEFFDGSIADPVDFLTLQPLLQFQSEGNFLSPGELIMAYPPFCTEQAAQGVALMAAPALELLKFHSTLASQWPTDGGSIVIAVAD
jgi:hypothetical protein